MVQLQYIFVALVLVCISIFEGTLWPYIPNLVTLSSPLPNPDLLMLTFPPPPPHPTHPPIPPEREAKGQLGKYEHTCTLYSSYTYSSVGGTRYSTA